MFEPINGWAVFDRHGYLEIFTVESNAWRKRDHVDRFNEEVRPITVVPCVITPMQMDPA